MARLSKKKKVGIYFWLMASAFFAAALYGILTADARFFTPGLVGGAWFTLMACLPRDLFVKTEGNHQS